MLIHEPKHSSPCVSELTLDQLKAGELSLERTHAVSAHLAHCRSCAARSASMARDARSFLASAESAATLGRLRAVERPRMRRTSRWLAAAALAAGACLSLLPSRPSFDVTRTKGAGVSLSFFVKRGESVRRGSDEMRVHAGDRLRFAVRTERAGYLAIVSIDGAGVVTTYFPVPSTPAPWLEASATERALDASIELDDTPGRETIAALLCDAASDLARARRALEASRTIVDFAGCRTAVVHVGKEPQQP